MKPLLSTENVLDACLHDTTFVPVQVANQIQFACDALDRLPLAESVLLL